MLLLSLIIPYYIIQTYKKYGKGLMEDENLSIGFSITMISMAVSAIIVNAVGWALIVNGINWK